MTFAQKVKFFFTKIGEFLFPFIKQFFTEMGQFVLTIAYGVVVEVAKGGLKGKAAQEAAFNGIVNQLKAKGFELGVKVTTSMINSAIEAGYKKAVSDGVIKKDDEGGTE
jgi:hypothetical protein